MVEHNDSTATGSAKSPRDRAAEGLVRWDGMESQFLARSDMDGDEGIVKFDSLEDLTNFLGAHIPACSSSALAKLLESRGRNSTDAWTWEHLNDLALQYQQSAAKDESDLRAEMTSELCEEVWMRWQRNEFPLLKPSEFNDEGKKNMALAITARLPDEDKPLILEFTARNHRKQHHTSEECLNQATIAHSDFVTWLQGQYYPGICEYQLTTFIETNTLPHRILDGKFHPFVTPTSIRSKKFETLSTEDAATAVADALEKVNQELLAEWKQIRSVVGPGSTSNLLHIA